MALPKHKISKSRSAKRRTHKKLSALNLSTCPDCGEATQPHHACPSCGSYKGRNIISKEED